MRVPAEALVSDLLDLRLQGIVGPRCGCWESNSSVLFPDSRQTDFKDHPSATPLPSRTRLLVLLKTVH